MVVEGVGVDEEVVVVVVVVGVVVVLFAVVEDCDVVDSGSGIGISTPDIVAN